MKRLYIDRIDNSASATLSRIWSPDALFKLFGLERRWLHNRSNVSCIPPGVYAIVEWKSPHFGDVWTFVGGTVTPFATDVPRNAGRHNNHIHGGNYWTDLEGCLAPGLRRGVKDGELCVWSSQDALTVLKDALGPPPHVAYVRCELGGSEED